MNELCNRISDILRYECKELTYSFNDDKLTVDLDCYAMTGTAAEKLAAFARETGRSFIITIQSIADPKIQIVL